jgi:hypothetical protein
VDFMKEHTSALAVTGTVELPFPFPASGQVYVIAPTKQLGLPAHFIKIVQIVNERQFQTWFVEPVHVRAVRIPSGDGDKAKAFGGWILKADVELKNTIEAGVKDVESNKGQNQILLYPQAIVLVHESAPVITRYEFVMTAAECGEQFGHYPCPVCPPPNCPKKKGLHVEPYPG